MKNNNEQAIELRDRISVECEMSGISKAELARRIGKSPQALNAMLANGDMKATVLKKVSEVLEVPMEILLTPVTDQDYVEARKRSRLAKK